MPFGLRSAPPDAGAPRCKRASIRIDRDRRSDRPDYEFVVEPGIRRGRLSPSAKRGRSKPRNPFFAARLDAAARLRYLRWIDDMGLFVQLQPVHPRVASHPEDDLILATALVGAVDYLVTGDRQLLALGSYEGIPIVRPTDFVALLNLQP